MNATFRVGTRIVAGLGSLSKARAEFTQFAASRIVLVADRGLSQIGVLDGIVDRAGVRDLIVQTVLTDVNPEPTSIEQAAAAARRAEANAVLGVGGGSGLGAAKAVALLMTNDGPLRRFEGADKAEHLPAPTVAIPTTAGSGSEVSMAFVAHDPALVRELVVRGAGYEPRTAILDGSVLRNLPRRPLEFAALDAITHALESMWARGSSMFTVACARHAADELIATLPDSAAGAEDGRNAVGENDAVLQRLLEASCLANLACGNSGLALVHALSSSPAVGLPHGLQNGILLTHVAQFNRDVVDSDTQNLIDRLPHLYDEIGFHPQFPAGAADAEAMISASRGQPFRVNNRRAATDDELRELLAGAGAYAPTLTH